MDDPIWNWLKEARYRGCDVDGLSLFWQGTTLPVLIGLLVCVNLMIFALVIIRCLRRSITDREPHL
jgi:hypothetical protein